MMARVVFLGALKYALRGRGGAVLLLMACCAWPLWAPAREHGDTALPPKGELSSAQTRTIEHGGERRSYLIAVPQSGSAPRPLVVLLHGGTQTAQQVWVQTSLPTLGRREGFIVVAPQGLGKHWNDGRGSTIARDGPSNADDVGFLRAVIADVIQHDGADPAAVFMLGASNGGFMTMRYACEAGDTLRAAASIISNLPRDAVAHCHPAKPLPWLAINGTDDPLIPFGGQPDDVVKGGQKQAALLSADASFAFWAEQAHCAPGVSVRHIGQAERRERGGCAGHTSSVQYVLHGSGHVSPGLEIHSRLIKHVVGEPNLDVDTGTIAWDHFRAALRAH